MSAVKLSYNGHNNIIQLQYIYDGAPYKFNNQGAKDLHISLKNKATGETKLLTAISNPDAVSYDNNGYIYLSLGKEGIAEGKYDVTGIVKGLHNSSSVIINKNQRKSKLVIKSIDI
jgi:hypothetical protein